jgi:1-acyl-sn-glycerol-3-phosphate acyltransferase
MTGALRIDGGELPSTVGVRVPHTRLITRGRFVPAAIIRTWWNLEIHGAENVPTSGPVVMAANHVGWLDGPMLAICAPRPVHALTKMEMFSHGMGAFLTAVGQIPLDRFHVDVLAIRVAVKSLEEGLAVGVFPEGTRGAGDMASPRAGAAYLALVTGAPVVPVAFLGTRMPGTDRTLPPRGTRLAMTFGEPVDLGSRDWPRTQQDMADAAAHVTDAILQTIHTAEQATGMTLPGPLGPKPSKKRR